MPPGELVFTDAQPEEADERWRGAEDRHQNVEVSAVDEALLLEVPEAEDHQSSEVPAPLDAQSPEVPATEDAQTPEIAAAEDAHPPKSQSRKALSRKKSVMSSNPKQAESLNLRSFRRKTLASPLTWRLTST